MSQTRGILTSAEVGKRYLVQFSLEDNSFSDIYDIPVPER
jgi:hypothetical protein